MNSNWKFCPECGASLDGAECNHIETDCVNYEPKLVELKHEVGELGVGCNTGYLYKWDGCDWVNITTENKHIDCTSISPLEIGSTFTTTCDTDIFSDGVGEFVLIKNGAINGGELILMEQDHDGHAKGSIRKLDKHIDKEYDVDIVLPSINSGWWDRQIGNTGVWVRRYQYSEILDSTNYLFSCGQNINDSNMSVAFVNVMSALIDDIPTIPFTLSNGNFTAPKGDRS